MIVRYAASKQKSSMANQEAKLPSKKYIEYIKGHLCAVCAQTPVDAHHMEAVGMGGANKDGHKDYSCVPLCRYHHTEYHNAGIKYFRSHYNVDLWQDAFNLLRRYFVLRD